MTTPINQRSIALKTLLESWRIIGDFFAKQLNIIKYWHWKKQFKQSTRLSYEIFFETYIVFYTVTFKSLL